MMRIFLYIGAILFFLNCDKKTETPEKETINSTPYYPSKILLLKVDFFKRIFEGGKEISLRQHTYTMDSLPILRQYVPPSDFGNLRLMYGPTGDTLFEGSIYWMGHGTITYPAAFDTATNFSRSKTGINRPENNRLQDLHFEAWGPRDSLPWEAISRLTIVQQYMRANNKIGYFLYTPSVGIGNPLEWDWFFVFSR